MAIQLDLAESKFGIPFNGAYFRINRVAVERRPLNQELKFVVRIDVMGYMTSTPSSDTREMDFRVYNVSLSDIESSDGNEFLNKCYSWVMAQDDMQGSIGV
jgi:hypothetical protein